MYDPKSLRAEEFISDEEIRQSLDWAEKNKENKTLIDNILEKAKSCRGLSHREASVLLACELEEENEKIFALAEQIKKDFYGNRIVLFAPLYLPQRRKFFLLFRIFPIDFILTLVYNKSIKKGGDKVKKKKKKPTKSRVDVRTIVITAIVDFLVGLALLIIDKLT